MYKIRDYLNENKVLVYTCTTMCIVAAIVWKIVILNHYVSISLKS